MHEIDGEVVGRKLEAHKKGYPSGLQERYWPSLVTSLQLLQCLYPCHSREYFVKTRY